ncbi:MAG: response regulator transcription factor [Clostridia bacterium]|nr:response regulator transcription factor [Clostridia bacterium]
MPKKVLVVDDEKAIVDILKFNLKREGYETIEAYDGEDGLNLAMAEKPDLILLDVMLPSMPGFDVCKKIREKSNVPIIMLTARTDEIDKVLGLELGADDYITKPFGIREVMARVKANLRRNTMEASENAENKDSSVLDFGSLKIDVEKFEASKDGKVLELTLREFELLKFLASQPEKIFSRETLLEKVWGYEYFGDFRTVDVTVRRLREKIEDDASEPKYVMTKRGRGYYFNGKKE